MKPVSIKINSRSGVLTSVMALLWLPFLVLAFFAWPAADDFHVCMMAGNDLGWRSLFLILYHDWGGRYSAWWAAILVQPVVENLLLYRLVLLLTQILLLVSVFRFWRVVLAKDNRVQDVMVLAGFFVLLWWQVTPDMAEGFFWLSGVMVYIWPMILFFFLLGSWLKEGEKGVRGTLLFSLGLFLLVGFNEMAAAMAMALSFLMVKTLWSQKKRGLMWLIPAIAIVVAVLLLLLSPGNAQRLRFFPEGRDLLPALKIAAVSLGKLNGINLLNIPIWLIIVLLFPHIHRENFNPRIKSLLSWHPIWVFLAGQLMLGALLVIPAWSMGINPPLRVYTFLTPLWLMWFVWFWVVVRLRVPEKYFTRWWPATVFSPKVWVLVIVLSFGVNLMGFSGRERVYGGNIPRAWYDLAVRAVPYHRAMQERAAIVEQAKDSGEAQEVVVPALHNPPRTIFFLDIQPDAGHWINRLHAHYYGVERIRVEAPGP